MSGGEKITFGSLELDIMSVLWSADTPLTVAEVHTAVSGERDLAYTTVLTVLGNLYKKQAVDRARKGKAHVYWSRQKRDEAAEGFFQSLLEKIYQNSPAQMMAGFLRTRDALTEHQLAELKKELERFEADGE